MTEVVFRCKQPLVLNAYDTQRDVDIAVFKAACDQYKLAVGNVAALHGIQFYDGGFAVTGWRQQDASLPLPIGWRRDGASYRIMPAKRTAEGKALARELNSLELKGNTYPGVPNVLATGTVNGQGFHIFPRTEKTGDDWWLTLSKMPCNRDLAKIDREFWEPAKLSEYYAAKEAAE